MEAAELELDKATTLNILVRELGDVVDLAVMSGSYDLARSLNESLLESKRLYAEALSEGRLKRDKDRVLHI